MNFLLTNDDGWDAPGLAALAAAASNFGDVWIVAPATHMSGISHRITWEEPLRIHEKGPQRFALEGTPADCVRIGTSQLEVQFDWVFSGVNCGANLGTDVYLSGTVAATREAIIQGYRSLAFSQHRKDIADPDFDWRMSERFAERMIEHFVNPASTAYRAGGHCINFPDRSVDQVPQTEIVTCQLDRQAIPLAYEEDAYGRYVPKGVYNQRPRTPGKDVEVCFTGSISITGIDMDRE